MFWLIILINWLIILLDLLMWLVLILLILSLVHRTHWFCKILSHYISWVLGIITLPIHTNKLRISTLLLLCQVMVGLIIVLITSILPLLVLLLLLLLLHMIFLFSRNKLSLHLGSQLFNKLLLITNYLILCLQVLILMLNCDLCNFKFCLKLSNFS